MRHAVSLASLLVLFAFSCGGDGAVPVGSRPTVPPAGTSTPEVTAETLAFLGDGHIWLVEPDGNNERQLSRLNTVEALSWISPDELDVVTRLGTEPARHLLMDLQGNLRELPFPAGGSWSRDGTQYVVPVGQEIVVFDREGGEVARLRVTLPGEEGPKPKPPNCGGTLSTGDGQPDRFTFGPPVFSPDGQRILAAVNCESRRGATGNLYAPVYEVSLDGATNRPLPLQTNLEDYVGARFSPDGSHVAQPIRYGGSACSSGFSVFVADADGANSRELTLTVLAELLQAEPAGDVRGGLIDYDWSPESDAVVASYDVSLCTAEPSLRPVLAALYLLRLDGSAPEHLVDGPTNSPAWSPSGRYIAYVSGDYFGREPGDAVIAIYDRVAGGRSELWRGSQPAWRPTPPPSP